MLGLLSLSLSLGQDLLLPLLERNLPLLVAVGL